MAFPTFQSSNSSAETGDVTVHTVALPTGSPLASITVETPTAERSAHVAYRITGAGTIEAGTANEQNTDSPNPPSHTPSGGSADYLWLAALAMSTLGFEATAYPSGYSNGLTINSGGSGPTDAHAVAAMAMRTNTASSEDPGPFTVTGVNHGIVNTMSVAPGTGELLVVVFVNDQPNGTAAPDAPGGWSTLFSFESAETDSYRMTVFYMFITDNASVFFDLTDMPADFASATTGSIEVRTQGIDISSGELRLYAQIFQSDESTPLTAEVLVATETTEGGWSNNTVAFSGVSQVAGKGIWDGAKVRFRWSSA